MLLRSLAHLSSSSFHTFISRESDTRRRRRRNCKWKWRIQSSLQEKEEKEEFEIDRDKAREALKRLDQQIQTLSQPPPSPPKPSPSPSPSTGTGRTGTGTDADLERDDFFMRRAAREEMPEISDSYLLYAAGALVILTIFNNIIFSFLIKPSIDGYEKPIILERLPLSEPQ